jgi:hypothetical protein
MPEKPAPKPDDETYSDEETARRRDAIVRAMIGMKPKPHHIDRPATPKKSRRGKKDRENE